MRNELYQSPPSKDFTCSSLTSRDYVPFSGYITPVYPDSMPFHQDLTPIHQDLTPGHQDSSPVHQEFTYIYQDLIPVCQDSTPVYQDCTSHDCQDFVPASQVLPIVKNVVLHQTQFLSFISLLLRKVWFRCYMIKSTIEKNNILRDTGLLNPY